MARKGRSLEILISHLERHLHENSDVTIESPKFLVDRTTGKKREHDVVLTFKHENHDLIVAIECRDRKSKVDSSHIEAFGAKCRDTGVNKGVIVTSNEFTKPALEKAKHLNISCFDISQATSFEWLSIAGIHLVYKRLLDIKITINPKKDFKRKPKIYEVCDGDGNKYTDDIWLQNIKNHFSKEKTSTPPPPGIYNGVIVFPGTNIYIKTSKRGKLREVKDVVVKVKIEVLMKLVPFNLIEYKNIEDNKIISTAAVADIDIEPFKGKLVMVYDIEKGGTISLIKSD